MARVRSRTTSPLGVTLFCLLGGIVCIGTWISAVSSARTAAHLDANGTRLICDVVGSRYVDRGDLSDTYLTIAIPQPGGAVHHREAEVSSAVYRGFKHATPEAPLAAAVVVDPSNDANWMIQHDLDHHLRGDIRGSWLTLLFGIGLIGVAGVAAVYMVRSLRRGLHALQSATLPHPGFGHAGGMHANQQVQQHGSTTAQQ